jgi:hypothetical protein
MLAACCHIVTRDEVARFHPMSRKAGYVSRDMEVITVLVDLS